MSSETSTEHGRSRPDSSLSTPPPAAMQPWQFFVLAGLGCATAVTFLVRGQGVTVVLLVLGYHHVCMRLLKRFEADANTHGHVWYRWFNEAPVVLMLLAVVLVVVKPF